MNTREQTFCTKLGAWLKKTKPIQSMLIEAKVVDKGATLPFSELRKGQKGTFNRLMDGLPVVYKISDGAQGSKLVDMLYISPQNTRIDCYVAVHFMGSKKKYLFPYWVVTMRQEKGLKSIPETELLDLEWQIYV